MNTISIAKFVSLVANSDAWQREENTDLDDYADLDREIWNHETRSYDQVEVRHCWGWASKTSTLGDIKITYTEGFNYDDNVPDSLLVSTDGQDEVWKIEGVVVVDEYGDELVDYEIADYLDSDFTDIDYSVLKI